MYTTLQQAAAQEVAFKAAIEELNRSLAAQKENQHENSKSIKTPLGQAHDALDSLLSAEWGHAPLPSISEEDDIPMMHTAGNSSPVKRAMSQQHAARMVELQRQVSLH